MMQARYASSLLEFPNQPEEKYELVTPNTGPYIFFQKGGYRLSL
jgi:hypothetical protein